MKTIILTVIGSLFAVWCQGQNSPKQLLGSFVYDNKVYTYDFAVEGSDTYSLNISRSDGNQSEAAMRPNGVTSTNGASVAIDTTNRQKDNDTSNAKALFYEFTKSIFVNVFRDQMIKRNFAQATDTTLAERGKELFYKIDARLSFLDDEPITAYMILKQDYVWSILRNNSSIYYDGRLSKLLMKSRVNNVSIETEEGAMKNIYVRLTSPKTGNEVDENRNPRKRIEFKNRYPISISGKFDPEKFANVDLYCINCGGIRGLSRTLRLSDLINMNILFETDKED